jgi:SAM-dependent methyltransferase
MGVWPLPAVLAWALAWVVFKSMDAFGAPWVVALGGASAVGVALSLLGDTWWRRMWIGAGFPISLAFTMPTLGLMAVPAWAWLVPLAVLLLIYPVNAWRDAPVFPTPPDALSGAPEFARLSPGARILDAGCGLGDGLLALRHAYPQAQLCGIEYAWPLRVVCALRCPWAQVRQGDIWQADWSKYAMVYLFQRPESMARAVEKAAELPTGAWLVSLEFEANQLRPVATYRAPGGKMVWLYQAPFQHQ